MESLYNEHGRPGPMVSPDEAAERVEGVDLEAWRALENVFPVRVSRSWMERVQMADDPLGRQVLPQADELIPHEDDLDDPVGEAGLHPVPWVVQKHADRALLLVTHRCHVNCRYCFRRNLASHTDPTSEELDHALDYLKGSGVHEVILSGGDPLVLRDEKLDRILSALRPSVPLVRIHTRAAITFPQRITPELVSKLRAHAPIWVVVHVNHPDELTPEVREGLGRFVDAGIPVQSQAVLLRGVNDDVDTLVRLVQTLVTLRVRPYYLHHPDHVTGNAGFRVGIEEGLTLYNALRKRVGGLALPQYVIDPPDGSGKVPVAVWATRSVPSG